MIYIVYTNISSISVLFKKVKIKSLDKINIVKVEVIFNLQATQQLANLAQLHQDWAGFAVLFLELEHLGICEYR